MNLRNRFLVLAAPILVSTLLLHGQATPLAPTQVPAWIAVVPESATAAVVLPAGTTYRFGDMANNRWSTAITVTVPTPFSPVSFPAGVFPFGDPDPGTVKELDVLQTAAPQTIPVTDLSLTPSATFAQIVPGTRPPTEIPTLPGMAYTVTFSHFMVAQGTGSNTPSVALVNLPPTLANRGWQGTQMNVVIDGVTLVCSAGSTATNQSVALSCTVPLPATP